jgi:hypothetical protein
VVVILALRFAWLAIEAATRRSDGFGAYYTSAVLLRDGDDVAHFYDDRWFNAQVGAIVPGVQDIYTPNPPTTAALMLPLAPLSYGTARTIWTVLNLMLLAVVLWWMAREARLSTPWALGLASLALIAEPVYANLRQGQAYVLLLALTVFTWHGYRSRRDGLAGIALGLMLVFKTAGILLPLLLIRRRRWFALGATCVTGLIVFLASLLTMGESAWRTYFDVVSGQRNEADFAVTAYQNQFSLVHHLFVFDPQWNPHPLFQQRVVGEWLSFVATTAVVAAALLILWRSRSDDLSLGALVIASIVISPYSLDYHYTLLLLPIAILVGDFERGRAGWSWVPLASGCLLIAAPLPYLSTRLSSGAWALLAYPKLYGALLLLGLSMFQSLRDLPESVEHDQISLAASRLALNDV